MSDSFEDLWRKYDDGAVDEQEPECEWSETQQAAVDEFRAAFNIDCPAHDYFPSKSHSCMIVRFTRTPRRNDNQFYVVEVAVNDESAARGKRSPDGTARGIYLLVEGQKYSKHVSDLQLNAIINLYNSIKPSDLEN